MLVRQPVITIQRVGDRRMSACEQMDARFEQYNTTFHATRAFVRESQRCGNFCSRCWKLHRNDDVTLLHHTPAHVQMRGQLPMGYRLYPGGDTTRPRLESTRVDFCFKDTPRREARPKEHFPTPEKEGPNPATKTEGRPPPQKDEVEAEVGCGCLSPLICRLFSSCSLL